MVNRRVMITLDGKEPSVKALHWYMDNMKKPGDHVVLFHCSQLQLNVMIPGAAVNIDRVSQQVRKAQEAKDEIITKANATLNHEGIKVYSVVKSNSKPHEAILAAAAEEDVAHIVMGTRDLGTVKRALVGSVSTEVVRHASVPVTIVKYGQV